MLLAPLQPRNVFVFIRFDRNVAALLIIYGPHWLRTTVVLIAELIWSAFGIVWLYGNYVSCPHSAAKEVLLGNYAIYNFFPLLGSFCFFNEKLS